ncbi:MAG: IS4 family transposase [Pseudomonadota bacterium]
MRICGKAIGLEVIDRIKGTLEADPQISRRRLSRQVCEWLDWRGPSGRLQDGSCRKLLLELDRREFVRLPEIDPVPGFGTNPGTTTYELPAIAEVECELHELGKIDFIPIVDSRSEEARIWKALMKEFHYLGKGPLCGPRILYLVRSRRFGWLAALSFSGAVNRMKERDKWIGWTEKARYTNLHRVVCNSRFLILPQVRVKYLASHVLSRTMARLGNDWNDEYGYIPVLAETFVDPARFDGTCYYASNWTYVGDPAGRSTQFPNGKASTGKKKIFLHPLRRNWREILCHEPPRRLEMRDGPDHFKSWADEEFGALDLFDRRLTARLLEIAEDFFAQPGALIPQACNGSIAKTKAAYRFFDNRQIDMQVILKPHVEASAQRIKEHEVVLAVQDTTTLNYTSHPSTQGIGPIGTKKQKGKGLLLHGTMAFTPEGTPLGLLDVQCWARDPAQAGKKYLRKELPIEEKESVKWLKSYRAAAEVQALCPDTKLVSVGDRESDIYELFYEAQIHEPGPDLLVRAEKTRNRQVDQEHLWTRMGNLPVAGGLGIQVPRRGSRAARRARLEVRYAPVELQAPKGKKLPSVKVWAVYAREIGAPGDAEPVEWMLLTTVEVNSFEDALKILRWYEIRWNIEIYHRILKSGCRIEDRRLNTADRLDACLGIDMVVGWRVFRLVMQGRETPNLPCDVILSADEWKVLWAVDKQRPHPEEVPCLSWAVTAIAILGGFLNRKKDGHPGPTTVWRGLERLLDMVLFYKIGMPAFVQRE